MKQLSRQFTLAALVASAFCVVPGAARADHFPDVSQIQVTYHGGPLLQHVQVITLFWGQGWDSSPLRDHMNNFFQALFADGRYMANLSQYSAPDGSYTIGNGQFLGTATDATPLGSQVTDQEIRAEIGAQINAGALPFPKADYVYVVCTPPGVEVINRAGDSSEKNFLAYHDYAADNQGDWATYLVVPAPDDQMMQGAWGIQDPADEMTQAASHELAEDVTDPLLEGPNGGWYDDNLLAAKIPCEIGDIPQGLVISGQLDQQGLFDSFTAADGTPYLVQKEWSQQDGGAVAFGTESAQ